METTIIKQCEICDKQLDENYKQNPQHFIVTCEEHTDLGTVFQPWLVRKRLGYKFNLPKIECRICKANLTQNEIGQIEEGHFNIVCNNHKEYANIFDVTHHEKK